MRYVNVDRVERIETVQTSGRVFIGTRTWQEITTGETFPLAVVTAARAIAQENPGNEYGALRAWAAERGYNAYQANLLAGHFCGLV